LTDLSELKIQGAIGKAASKHGTKLEKKAATAITLIILLIGTLILTSNTRQVMSEPGIKRVPQDYLTIQEAIDAASPGDTIQVAAGTYYENVVVNKAVLLIGENSSTTIINAKGTGTVVKVTASSVVITNFTIQNSGSGWPNSGVLIDSVSACSISNNTITNNWYGIWLKDSSNNVLSSNNIANNQYGVWMESSSNNTLSSNSIAMNQYNLGVWGLTLSHFIQNTDITNYVNSKPIYYWINQHNGQVPQDAGYVALVNSTEMTVENLTITNNGQGILLAYTQSSSIANNNITNNWVGIELYNSSNNTLSNNNITNNQYGTWLFYSTNNTLRDNNVTNNLQRGIELFYSSNNTIYHNNFNNTQQTTNLESTNLWDNGYPSGGNFWSDYTGTDSNGDGIGDTPYIIDENNRDRYPLMNPPAHNIAIISAIPSKTEVYAGQTLNITVVIKNKGTITETFNVSAYYDTTIIETRTVTNLIPNTQTTLTFIWETMGVTPGTYTITVIAHPVIGETETDDNTCIAGTVQIYEQIRDIAILNVTLSANEVYVGQIVNITVTYKNEGTITETFNLSIYYDNNTMLNLTIEISPDNQETITYNWNTTDIPYGNYTIKAVASIVPEEIDIEDNTFIGGTLSIKLWPNIAITEAALSKTVVGQGHVVDIDVTIENQGSDEATFNVSLYWNDTIIGTFTNITLTGLNSLTISFTWNTSGWTKGVYIISAHASLVPGETNTDDNTLIYDTAVIITVPGDTDGDRDIDIYDIVRLTSIYGAKRSEPGFNPNCDIDGNDVINIFDVVIATSQYGYKGS
jgi:parallel beta-helix repeat protein